MSEEREDVSSVSSVSNISSPPSVSSVSSISSNLNSTSESEEKSVKCHVEPTQPKAICKSNIMSMVVNLSTVESLCEKYEKQLSVEGMENVLRSLMLINRHNESVENIKKGFDE
jgi:hypothetical protein